MENEKYLTVKQFAEAVGISQQAVYQAIQGKLKPYIVKEGRQRFIKEQAITDLYSSPENVEQMYELKELVKAKQAEIENLNKALEELNKKLEKLEFNLNKELELNEQLTVTISEKDKEITELKQIQDTLKADSSNFNKALNETEIQLADARARAEEKDKLIDELRADKTKLNKRIDEMQEDTADIVTSLKQLTADKTKLEYQMQEYRQEQKKGFFKRLFKR